MKSFVCRKFDKRIGNEILYQTFMDEKLEKAMSKMHLTDWYKKQIGIPEKLCPIVNLNMNDFEITIQARKAMFNMRFIYLINLFEAFVKEYLEEREGNTYEKIKNKLSDINKKWVGIASADNYISISKSFMNLRYSLFMLKEKYGVAFDYNSIKKFTLESGSLRNCIVHHNGNINYNEQGVPFSLRLKETISYLNNKEELVVTKDLLVSVINDISYIIEKCDY